MRSDFLVFLVLLSVQVYLIGQLRAYLQNRISNAKIRQKLIFCSTCFPILTLLPLAWRAYFGFYENQPYFWFVRELFTLCSIWWMGSVGCGLVLFAYNLFCRLILSVPQQTPAQDVDLKRRTFIRKGFVMAAAAPFMVSGYGGLLERRRFELERFDIGIGGLSSSLSQLKIAQLSDIHVGPFMAPEELAEYVDAVNRLQPDVIALTGDFVTSRHDEVLPCVEALAKLKARYGIFACLGNHDIYAGVASELTRRFRESGIYMLRNDAIAVQVGNSKLGILGIDDLGRGRPNLKRALTAAQNDPAEVNILLSHRPEIFPRAAQEGIDLVLSGHYHGGQVKLLPDPQSLSIARFMTPYADGLFTLPFKSGNVQDAKKESTLFVSRGVGVTALPIRINCPPQIAHLTLKRA